MANDSPRLSIVIPTYNERSRLGELVEAISTVFRDAGIAGEMIVVDDNSPDGTGAFADTLTRDHALRVVHRPGKLGLGRAVMDGFRVARGSVMGVMDADLSHPPLTLPRMLQTLDTSDADFIVASRYVPGGGTKDWPHARLMLSRLACLLARPLSPVRDATSGFFLIARSVTDDLEIRGGGFKICLELLVRGRVTSVVEVPYTFVGRRAGDSKMNLREATGYLHQLRDLWRTQRRAPGRPRPAYRCLAAE